MVLEKARQPFQFYTRHNLTELTGLKASNITELVALLKEVPGSSIYHHTHRILQQHEFLSPEPPNDFAYWISNVLGDEELGERIASIDIVQFKSIRELREKIVSLLEGYVEKFPDVKHRFAKPGKELFFMKSLSFILPTKHVAENLPQFAEILDRITVNSLYFHIFEARLRLENKSNDFSYWIETSLDGGDLALEIEKLDPYTFALDDLRKTIIKLVKKRL